MPHSHDIREFLSCMELAHAKNHSKNAVNATLAYISGRYSTAINEADRVVYHWIERIQEPCWAVTARGRASQHESQLCIGSHTKAE